MNNSKANSNSENEFNHIITYKDYNTKNQNRTITSQNSENNVLNKKEDKKNLFTNWFKKNFYIKLIVIISSVLIIITVILLAIFLRKKKKENSSSSHFLESSNSNCDTSSNGEDDIIILPSNETIVAKLNYDINEMFIYNEISNSTMKYSFDSDSSLRTLTESVNTIKNYKYLSFVYDISKTPDGIEKYFIFHNFGKIN